MIYCKFDVLCYNFCSIWLNYKEAIKMVRVKFPITITYMQLISLIAYISSLSKTKLNKKIPKISGFSTGSNFINTLAM
jgi:hypothetical protein